MAQFVSRTRICWIVDYRVDNAIHERLKYKRGHGRKHQSPYFIVKTAQAHLNHDVSFSGARARFNSLDARHLCLCLRRKWKPLWPSINPLSPKSDRHQISPYNINALENRVVMRIEYMIREDESNWYFNKFSPVLLLNKYRDSKWESQFWSYGLKG